MSLPFGGHPGPEARGLRSRTGCWACRTRSVKCDETKPVCRGCTKMGLSCHYGIRLQWIEDSVARGICHGRERREKARLCEQRRGARPASAAAPPGSSLRRRGCSGSASPRLAACDATTYFINTSTHDVDYYFETAQLRSHGLLLGRNDLLCITSPLSTSRADKADEEFSLPCSARLAGRRLSAGQADEAQDEAGALAADQHWTAASMAGGDVLCPVPHTVNPAGLAWPLDGIDGILLQFYDRVVCASTTLLDDKDHNPFRFVILPLTVLSKNILSAVLAIGATKLAYINAEYGGRALAYRQRVLANLSTMLEDIGGDVLRYLEALASALILCWCDITDLCQPTWTKHLMGLASILDACPEEAYHLDYACGLIQTCRQYVVYHLVMAKATFRTSAVLPNAEAVLSRYLVRDKEAAPAGSGKTDSRRALARHAQPGSFAGSFADTFADSPPPLLARDIHQIEPSQGFSNSLLVLINDICDLASTDHAPSTAGVARRVADLEKALQTLVQLPPGQDAAGHAHRPGSDAASAAAPPAAPPAGSASLPADASFRTKVECGEAIAEANRLTALLFLDEMCALNFPDVVPRSRADRLLYMQKILFLVDAVCDKGPVTAALPIWPAFVAGCMVAGEDDRLQVLRILDKFQRRRIFGSIPPACAVIENVWRQRDLGSDENPRRPLAKMSLLPTAVDTARLPGKRGRKPKRTRRRAISCESLGMQYPWETAMCVLGTSVLSLT